MSKCEWKYDSYFCADGGAWVTSCDGVHDFIWGGPKDNDYKYCPYCGYEIEIPPTPELTKESE